MEKVGVTAIRCTRTFHGGGGGGGGGGGVITGKNETFTIINMVRILNIQLFLS